MRGLGETLCQVYARLIARNIATLATGQPSIYPVYDNTLFNLESWGFLLSSGELHISGSNPRQTID